MRKEVENRSSFQRATILSLSNVQFLRNRFGMIAPIRNRNPIHIARQYFKRKKRPDSFLCCLKWLNGMVINVI